MDWYDVLKEVARHQGRRFEERPLQRELVNILQRRFEEDELTVPLLIRLPCGYGKTQVGEAPFLGEAFTGEWITRGMVYTLPTRSLTEQQAERIRADIEALCRLKSLPKLSVSELHGETGTYFFYDDVIVSTFDTFIYAYARKARTGHHLEFPAGTISTSYVVFDEAHMIQDDYLYSHLVMNKVLRVLSKAGVPTIVMTATMPDQIKNVVFDGVSYEEYPPISHVCSSRLGSYRGEVREVHLHREDIKDYICRTLSPDAAANKRILVVCNTVSKAQGVYHELAGRFSGGSVSGRVILLHSRYAKIDRQRWSSTAIKLMKGICESCEGKMGFPVYLSEEEGRVYCDRCATPSAERVDFVILVATQVVEAGLDISADWLLTDMAPLDALVQRAGRCSRFPGESNGRIDVFYYDKVHLPYQQKLVEKAYEILENEDDKGRIRSLTDFTYSSAMINKNYDVFRREVLGEHRHLRLYLGYLEGNGFSTFSVDWELLRQISARPNAFVTLVAFSEDEDIPVCFLKEEEADLRVQGRYRSYRCVAHKSVKYHELLSQMRDETICINRDFVLSHSFSLERNYAISDNKPKPFLQHDLDGKTVMVELKPVIVDVEGGQRKRECYYLVREAFSGRVDESNYLVNAKLYDEKKGLEAG